MTVRDLLSRADSAELTDWQAYFVLERKGSEKPKGANVVEQLMGIFGRKDGNG